ncbi:hypothetical protein [Nonomuraea gerenzanensis]|uniref:Uncharacterized protein n=1 Tax=Nonomuraea gerenzanensis TaxID=93944 RepID=A0A1M4EC18_9ACTN|nr:hypothetical protein [Nonomuraea gerenzanensis]UBU18500.1 hypothetical protein LCN96_26815 [Nonomuraea gerenzanensis]SBO96340.1 hypothetical protein BN4615_P5856 [Nonomuraea gerenzanensis]
MRGILFSSWAVRVPETARGSAGLSGLFRLVQALPVLASGRVFCLVLILRQSGAALGLFSGGRQSEVMRFRVSACLVEVAAARFSVGVAGLMERLLSGAVQSRRSVT